MKPIPMNHPVTRRGITVALACAAPAALFARSAHAAADSPAQAALLKLEAAYIDAWNRHDADAVAAAFHPDGVRWSVSSPAGLRGAAIQTDARALFGIYPDLRLEVARLEPIDDLRLVKQFVLKGTWSGRFPAGPFATKEPSGRSFAVPAVALIEYRDGRIITEHTYFDRLSLLAQIGAITL